MENKQCIGCGITFFKNIYDSYKIWQTRKFCSTRCASVHRDRSNIGYTKIKKDGCYAEMLKEWKTREIEINNKYKTWQLNQ